jgi:hypothetical protein
LNQVENGAAIRMAVIYQSLQKSVEKKKVVHYSENQCEQSRLKVMKVIQQEDTRRFSLFI